jgi:hypothetical protein
MSANFNARWRSISVTLMVLLLFPNISEAQVERSLRTSPGKLTNAATQALTIDALSTPERTAPQDSPSAVQLLNDLARSWKNRRILAGVAGLGGGALLIALTEGSQGGFFDFSGLVRGMGLAYMGAGAISLAIPSKAEKEAAALESLSGPDEREHSAHASLVLLAKRARRARILNGSLAAGLAAYTLIDKDFVVESSEMYAGLFGVTAFVYLVGKSREETLLERYEASRRDPSVVSDISIGMDLRGRPRLTARIVF